jgi:hypothetical protein
MKIKKVIYTNVGPNGELPEGGSIETDPFIRHSGDGCPIPNCNCSPPSFVTIGTGLENRNVTVLSVVFEEPREYRDFLAGHDVYALEVEYADA